MPLTVLTLFKHTSPKKLFPAPGPIFDARLQVASCLPGDRSRFVLPPPSRSPLSWPDLGSHHRPMMHVRRVPGVATLWNALMRMYRCVRNSPRHTHSLLFVRCWPSPALLCHPFSPTNTRTTPDDSHRKSKNNHGSSVCCTSSALVQVHGIPARSDIVFTWRTPPGQLNPPVLPTSAAVASASALSSWLIDQLPGGSIVTMSPASRWSTAVASSSRLCPRIEID